MRHQVKVPRKEEAIRNKIVALVGGVRQAIEAGDKAKTTLLLDKISRLAAGETSE